MCIWWLLSLFNSLKSALCAIQIKIIIHSSTCAHTNVHCGINNFTHISKQTAIRKLWINQVFRINVFTPILVSQREKLSLLGGMIRKCGFLQNIFNIQDSVINSLSMFVHWNTVHLAPSSSCLLLSKKKTSAHLLAAVQPIISLPPFLCSSSSLGHAQGRRGEGGREERRKGRAPLLWHRHKGIPCTGLGPPTPLLSPCLAPRHTPVHTHCCLHSRRRNRPTREDEEWET